jgi:hypothetical protein
MTLSVGNDDDEHIRWQEHDADVLDQRWHVVATGSVPHVVERCSDVTLPSAAGTNDAVSHQLVKMPIIFTALLYNRQVVFVLQLITTRC